jgi:transcriptional regulator with XRE-family HTH domain
MSTRDFNRAVGRRIRFWRDERGFTTESLAQDLGVSPITVQRHMRGENAPDLENIARYATALQVTTDQLLPRLDSNQEPTGYRLSA